MQFGGYRIYDQQGAYFLTFTVVDWIDVFTRPAYKQVLIEALRFYQNSRGLKVFGYVIMTNHLHLLAQTPEHHLSDFIRDFKRWTSRKLKEMLQEPQESRKSWIINRMEWRGKGNTHNHDFQFWQRGSHPVAVWSMSFAWEKLNYIHHNPVRAGIVLEPEAYLYSSARNYAGYEGMLPVTLLELDLSG